METEVVVVGAGPTGLVLAGELAMRGIGVEVLERDDAPSGQARGGGLNARTSEVLDMRGLLDETIARAVPREGGSGHFAGLPVPLDATPWRTRWPVGLLVPQDRLESLLEDRLRELGVTVRRGCPLTGVTVGADAVRAETPTGPVDARFLAACDGGHSTVRKLTGTGFPGLAGTMAAVTADVDLAGFAPTILRTIGHISEHTRSAGGYWMMAHPIGGPAAPDRYRLVFGSGSSSAERDAPVTDEEVAAALTAVHGPDAVLGRVLWATRFSDATRQVAAYREGPVLWAGDAAHIHPPMGGQGLNLGVQDALNLGWKLAAHLRGVAGVLDTYHAERHPVGAGVIARARAQRVLMNPAAATDDVLALRDVVIDLARTPDGNRLLAGVMSMLAVRYDLGDDHPLVGSRMPDLALDAGGAPTRVAELLRTGHGLLLDLDAAGSAPYGVRALRPGVDEVRARVLDSPVGIDLEARRVLVRPDGHVAWIDTGAEPEPGAALTRWFGTAAPMPV